MKRGLLFLLSIVISLLFSISLLGQSEGPNYPSSAANVSYGTVSWTNTTNILTDDSSIATATIPKNETTDYLVATNYGFSIPGTATIICIVVSIDKYTTGGKTYDSNLYLTKDGTNIAGSDYGDTSTKWQSSETVANYGGSADLWGTTWSPAEINSSNFGVMFTSTQASNGSEDSYVDYISITVYYTLPPCTPPSTQASIGSFTNNSTGTSVTGNWTRGNGDNILAVARETSTSAVAPSSGSSYTANTVFGLGNITGTGNYVVYNGTGTSVDVTGLTPETGYTFDIYEYNNTDVCYHTTASSGSFTTPALSTPMPFTESFESGLGSFTVISDASNYWMVGTNAGAVTGSNSAYITDDGSSYNYNNGTAYTSHIYVDLALPAGSNPFNLQFNWKCDGETSYDNLTVYMTQATPVAGSLTEISADQIGDTYYSEQTSWTTENIELDAATYAGANWKLVFTWKNDGSLGGPVPIAIDDIELSIISCPTPTNLTATSIAATQADLGWTESGSATTWDIELGTNGFSPTGTPTQSGVTNNPYTYTGLSASTDYEFYVRADCGGSDYSDWAGPFAFSTTCATYTPPFTEDFSTYVPYCWSETAGTLAAPSTLSGTSSTWADDGFANSGSTGSARINIYGTTADEWLITPSIDLGAGATDYQLEFDLALTYYNTTATPDLTGTDDIFAVVISTDDGSTWTSANTLQQWDNGGSSFVYNDISNTGERVIIDLTGYTGVVKFGFYAESTVSNADNDLFVDNVAVIEIPSCPQPTSLTATSIAATQADLGWTESGSGTTWDIELGTSGFSPTGTPTQSGVTSNPYTYTGLSASTDYEFYVRADCGGSDYSNWSGPYAFSTTCATYTPPFSEGFSTYVPNCWSETAGTLAAPSTLSGTTSTWMDDGFANSGSTGSARINIYGTTASDWLITPSIDLGAGATDYQLEFDLALTDYGTTGTPDLDGTDDIFAVVISTDNGSTWTSANTLQQWDNGGSSYVYNDISTTGERVIIDLTGYTGVVQFGFYGESTVSNADNDLFVDNVAVIEIPSCPQPLSLTATSINATQADLGWTEGGSATTWDIELGTSGFSPTGTPTQSGVTSNPYTYTGLSANSTYEFYVRADCGGDLSSWSGPFEFSTSCVPYTVPYFEGFESGYTDDTEIAGCLIQESVLGSATWMANSTSSTYNRTPRTGSYNATLYYSNDDWIFIPINLTNGVNYEVSLYARQDGSTSTNADITIAYGNSSDAASMTNTIVSATGIINGSYQNINGYFSPSSTGTFYVGILGSINGTPWYISMDDITIDIAPTCVQASDLVSSNITSSSADLDWTASISSPADGYDFYHSTSSTPPDGATTPTIENQSGTSYTLSSLNHSTTYYVWLRADCGSGDVSDWIGPEIFTTACGAIVSYPWLETFDSYLPPCWSEFEGTLAASTTETLTSSGWSSDDFANGGASDGAQLNVYGTTCQDWLVTPSINLGTGTVDYQLEFDLALTDFANSDPPESTGTDDMFAVVISTDDGATWSNANILQEWTNSSSPAYSDISTSGEHITIDMSGYTGTVKIGFYGESTVYDADNDLSIDNVSIVPIQDMEYVSSTTTQITGSVAPGATAQQIVCIQIDMLGTLNPINITSLTLNTTGTTSTSDISNATLWYTGTSSSFATTSQIGSVVASPSGSFSFTDNQELSSGTNYFLLTYDIDAGATLDNHIDAECTSITVDGTPYSPTTTAPAGYRIVGISYCDPAPSSVDNDGITNVTCGSINNTTGTETNNYGDYTAMSTNVTQGATVPIDITYSTGYSYYTVIWIDWNKDGDFDDVGEEVYSGESSSTNPTTLNAEFTVPVTASLGTHRLRIGGADYSPPDPCYTGTYGSFEDYTVNVVAATPMAFSSCTVTQDNTDVTAPNTYDQEIICVQVVTTGATNPFDISSFTFNITGSTAAADIANATLWTSGISSSFATTTQLGDVEVSPTGSFTINTGTNLPYTLSSGTNYFWLTYDIASTATVGNVVDAVCTSITVDGTPRTPDVTDPSGNRPIDVVYCEPTYTYSCSSDFISNVTFSTINNSTGCTGSSPSNTTLYSTPNPSLTQGNIYSLDVTTAGDEEGINVWIDWNHDGQFTITESVLSGFANTLPATYSTNITIPGSAVAGETRMRVRCGFNAAPTDACSNLSYGETEDYIITIVAGCAAPTVSAISPANSNICEGADPGAFSLTISGGTTPYSYQWYKDGAEVVGETSATYSPGTLSANTSIYCKAYSNGCAVDAQSPTANIYIDVPVVTASVSETGACTGTDIILSGGPSGMTTYSWTGPAGCTYTPDANSQSPTVTMGATSGSFTLTATNSNGCTADHTTEVVNVVPGAPSCSSNPSPSDAAVDIEPGTTLSWDAVSGATSYDVYFGASSLPATPVNMTGTSFAPILTPNVEYHWKIVPRNGCGVATGCSEWTFTAAAPTCDGIAIDPTTDGGFETGPDFSDSFWWSTSTADAYANQFVCETGATAGFTGSNCAYVTNNYGAATPPHAYDNGRSSSTHIFKDFAIPGGATNIKLDFNWIGNGESNRDVMKVYITPSYYTPVYGEEISESGSAPTGIIQVGEDSYSGEASWTSASTITIDEVYAGLNSVRLIFEWTNDNNSGGADPPFAVDNVSITYTCPPPPCALGAIDFTGSSHTPVLNSTEGIYYIDMCQGETLTLAASMDATPISEWIVNSYDGTGPERFTSAPLVYTVNYASGYDGSFVVNTGTCYSRIPFRIRSSSGPIVTDITTTLEGCAGTSQPVDIGSPTSSDIVADPYCGDINLKLGEGITTYIPDGPYCPERCFESSVTFTDFPVNSTLQSEENLLYLKINMEHSNIANIQISLNGPNNCGSAILVQDYYTYAQSVDAMDDFTYYWPYATTDIVTFGIPYTKDLETSGKPCNPTAALNYPGEGWDYCWSNNDDYSYANGYVYSSENHSPIAANAYLDYSINPSDMDNMTNVYHPFESFSNLAGCPLNGTWTIKVCDSEVKSNGWIFNWEMALSSDLMPSYWDYETSLDYADWTLTSASTSPVSEQTNPLVYDLIPDIGSTTGAYSGTFTVYDNFGCDTTANISYDITGIPAIPGIVTNDYVWTGDNTLNWDASTNENWIFKNPGGYSNATVIPSAGTNVFIVDYCNLNNNPTVSENVDCNNITILDGTLTVGTGNSLTISGNFDNQDTFVAENNSTVVFDGSGTQTIQSTSDLTFYDVIVNNSGLGIELQANVIVSNNLDMTDGNITTGANLISIGTSTANLGTVSHTDGSVIGDIRRWFDSNTSSNVVFPVGTVDYYRPAYISYTTAPTSGGTLTASFNASDPTMNGLTLDDGGNIIEATAIEGYWPINAGDGLAGGTYDVDLTATGFGVIDYTQLWLLKRANAASPWTLNGTHETATGSNEEPTVHRNGLSGFSEFAVGGKAGALPVELVEFNAACENGIVKLNWATISEINNDYFIVEKSTDLIHYYEVSRIKGSGNSNSLKYYSALDKKPFFSQSYYRLKQVDYDGTIRTFHPIALKCDNFENSEPEILVYPNPFNSELNIVFDNISECKAKIEIINEMGKTIITQEAYIENSAYTEKLDLNKLPPAVYYLKVIAKDQVFNIKVIKQ